MKKSIARATVHIDTGLYIVAWNNICGELRAAQLVGRMTFLNPIGDTETFQRD